MQYRFNYTNNFGDLDQQFIRSPILINIEKLKIEHARRELNKREKN
jgi:hypothetical protein